MKRVIISLFYFMDTNFHIGTEIQKILNEQKRSVSWLATKTDCDNSCLSKQLKKKHIHCQLLDKISKALKKDFFTYYSDSNNYEA